MKKLLLALAGAAVMSGPASAIESSTDYKLPRPQVSSSFAYESRFVSVKGQNIHYVEQGEGSPVLFIHGNPTTSYLWRNVIPAVSNNSRAVALDLIGMGQSDKPDIPYSFADHYDFVEGFIELLQLKDVTLVIHDWGAALGFEYARRHPDNVERIVFMEGVLPPAFPQPSFAAMGEEMGGLFKAFKDPIQGVELVINQNMFIEKTLPYFVNRPLSGDDMAAYRAPYLDPQDRDALLAWPREVPIAGEPATIIRLMDDIETFMETTDMDMLLLYSDPGVLIPPHDVPWFQQTIKNLETAYIGQGFHFVQEDQPVAIGRAINDWMRRHP